ncbi:MAG: HIT family protein [Crocinitomicaceae bacterium]
MLSIFTKIIAREIPAHIVAEDEQFIAFLDISPLQKGHTLVVPKKEVDYIFDVEDDLLADMILFAKKLSKKIKTTFPCNRIGMTVIGLEVPHAHIHLIPVNKEPDMNFHSPRIELSQEELAEIAERIKSA